MPKQSPKSCAPKKESYFPLRWDLYESYAWTELTDSEKKIFIHLYSRITWYKRKGKKMNSPNFQDTNNGEISVSTKSLMKWTGINSKGTITNAIAKLVKVGLIAITRYGSHRLSHLYKILYFIVPTSQERWRKYPEQDWSDEIPKAEGNLFACGVGNKTQWKKGECGNPKYKSHPKELDYDKSIELDQEEDVSLKNYSNGVLKHDRIQSN